METVSLRLEEDKIRYLEKEEALIKLKKYFGTSKKKTTDADLHKAREKAFDELK